MGFLDFGGFSIDLYALYGDIYLFLCFFQQERIHLGGAQFQKPPRYAQDTKQRKVE